MGPSPTLRALTTSGRRATLDRVPSTLEPDPGPPRTDEGTREDLPAILEIYNQSMTTGNSNFDSRPSTVGERAAWFDAFSTTGPHRLLVARNGGTVLGYACSRPYRSHEAFRETVEFSILLDSSARGKGVGPRLYSVLFEILADEPVHVALSGIALPNDASLALHRKFGFTEVGVFREYASKDGGYISSLWMQRLLRRRTGTESGRPAFLDPSEPPHSQRDDPGQHE